MYQLSLLQDDDSCRLEYKIEKNFQRQERLRKGTFARINELQKRCDELEKRLALLERNICYERVNVKPPIQLTDEKYYVYYG